MTPFQDNLELVIKKYVCQCHSSFPGIYYNPKKEVLSGMNKYNYSHNHLDFCLNWLFIHFLK